MKGDRNMKRFMKKMNEKKGFTLAELLIVVAIIAVLVAVAIPVFTSQLEKARQSTDVANLRSSYAEAMTAYLSGDATGVGGTYVVQHTKALEATATSGLQAELTDAASDLSGYAAKSKFHVEVSAPTGTNTKPTVTITNS